jgi:hypothetical protein
MVVTMLKNRVIHIFYIQIKFIIKFTHLHVFIAQRNLLSGHASYFVFICHTNYQKNKSFSKRSKTIKNASLVVVQN